ncbi:ligA [Scenedesmus sp. PABB004]|nr:ligA [Scenedesmus sp. PABB004]
MLGAAAGLHGPGLAAVAGPLSRALAHAASSFGCMTQPSTAGARRLLGALGAGAGQPAPRPQAQRPSRAALLPRAALPLVVAAAGGAEPAAPAAGRKRRTGRAAAPAPPAPAPPPATQPAAAPAPAPARGGRAATAGAPRTRRTAPPAPPAEGPAAPPAPAAARTARGRRAAAAAAPPPADAGDAGALAARARALAARLERYWSSYDAGAPEVDDAVYDSEAAALRRLLAELRRAGGAAEADRLEAASPLARVGSPANVAASGLRRSTHPSPMTSLAAVRDKAELLAWGARLARAGGVDAEADAWVVEPKVDGLAVRAVYRWGVFASAATRGDGAVGEDVSHNADHDGIAGLPRVLKLSRLGGADALPLVEVRGEVFITADDFEKVNAAQVAAGAPPFASPRNAAAGSLRLLDPDEAAARRLSFKAYQLILPEGAPRAPATQAAALAWMKRAGIATTAPPDGVGPWRGFSAAVEAAERWMEARDSLGYEVDGAVLKLDSLAQQAALGVDGGRDPRWAVAWKFPAKLATTRLLGIDWSVGRSGALTPVAHLEPVVIGGVTVQHASLHNVGQLRTLRLRGGDVVTVKRAGDVIPQVVGVLADARPAAGGGAPFEEPSHCPSCTQPLAFVAPKSAGAGGHLWCANPACPAQQLARVQHFVAVCVEGIGDATAQELWARGWLHTPAGLYRLTAADLLTLPGVRERKAAKMLAAIDASRRMSLATLLAGLGIPVVGARQAANLAARYKSMKALELAVNSAATSAGAGTAAAAAAAAAGAGAATAAGGAPPPPIGGVLGASLAAWFSHADSKLLLNGLRQGGVACCQEDPAAAEAGGAAALEAAGAAPVPGGIPGLTGPGFRDVAPLEGISICVTGSLGAARLSRRELAASFIEDKGGEVHGSVKRTTRWLVTGLRPGAAKLAAAAKWGTRVLDEAGFMEEVERLTLAKQGYVADGERGATSGAFRV